MFSGQVFLIEVRVNETLSSTPRVNLSVSALYRGRFQDCPSILLRHDGVDHFRNLSRFANLHVSRRDGEDNVRLQVNVRRVTMVMNMLNAVVSLFEDRHRRVLTIRACFVVVCRV